MRTVYVCVSHFLAGAAVGAGVGVPHERIAHVGLGLKFKLCIRVVVTGWKQCEVVVKRSNSYVPHF